MTADIRVFKFGGASVRDAAGIRNVGGIVSKFGNGPLAVVVSAIGKTTNALEEVVSAFAKTDNAAASAKLVEIKQNHYEVARQLVGDEHPAYAQLNDAFVEVEWLLEEPYDQKYDYVYDQIVSIGEIASSILLTSYLQSTGVKAQWLDARGLIRTDGLHREAWVDWAVTSDLINKQVSPALKEGHIVVTQGFIGSIKFPHKK